jgi:hypothetical protein
LSVIKRLKSIHLSYFSKPSADRPVFRAIVKRRVTSIVELGIGTGVRSRRLIEQAQRCDGAGKIRYTGIDLFETRESDVAVGLPLIEAHRMLKATGARVQLVPGDLFSALARVANELGGTDLVIISADQDEQLLQRAWFYLPRILHEGSVIFIEEPGEGDAPNTLRQMSQDEIERLASPGTRRRAA